MSDPRTQEHEAAAEKITAGWTGIEMLTADGSRRVVMCGRIVEDVKALIAAALADAVRVAREEDAKVLAHEAVANYDIDSPEYLALIRLAGVLRSRVGDAAATAKPDPSDYSQQRRWAEGEGDATPGPEPTHERVECADCGLAVDLYACTPDRCGWRAAKAIPRNWDTPPRKGTRE